MIYPHTATGISCALALIAGLAVMATPQAAAEGVDMHRAASELGIRLLRPDMQIEPGNQYVATIANPARLIQLGLSDVRPGDRVIFRALENNRIVVSSSDGDRTAPIQLAESGEIVKAEEIPQIRLQGLEQRELREPRQSRSRGRTNAPSGLSVFSR